MTSSTKPCWSAEHATSVRIENDLSAALTLNVATASLSFRPVNGRVSGPRWQEALMFTRHTWFTMWSMHWARHFGVAGENAHLLAIIAFGDVRQHFFKILEVQNRADWAELFFFKDGRIAAHGMQDGREEAIAFDLTTALVTTRAPASTASFT